MCTASGVQSADLGVIISAESGDDVKVLGTYGLGLLNYRNWTYLYYKAEPIWFGFMIELRAFFACK